MKVVAFAGGTGSAKLLRGLARTGEELTVVANVGDNFWVHGLYVCPDVDIAMYTLAGIADRKKGWGIRGDTFASLLQMGKLGAATWFNLGDSDLAVHVLRTDMVRRGLSLTRVTRLFSRALGVQSEILPATDDPLETHILTSKGELHLQEYWVKLRAAPAVRGVKYVGARKARPTREVARALRQADRIVLCPANPVTSIAPIFAISGMKALLSGARAPKVAVSPMARGKPFSGPAGELMKGLGFRSDAVGVASMYEGLVDTIVIDRADGPLEAEIEALGLRCVRSDIRMGSAEREVQLAREVIRT